MSSRFIFRVSIVVSVLSLLLASCQAPPSQVANPPSEASIEQMKATSIPTATRIISRSPETLVNECTPPR